MEEKWETGPLSAGRSCDILATSLWDWADLPLEVSSETRSSRLTPLAKRHSRTILSVGEGRSDRGP